MQSNLWYWEREGSSPPPRRPRRRTTKNELLSPSHRKRSPQRPKTRFLVSTCGGDVGSDDDVCFSASAGLWCFSPSRSRRNTAWLGSQVCHGSPSPTTPSAAAILAQLLASLGLLSPPRSAANPWPAVQRFVQSSSRKPGSTRLFQSGLPWPHGVGPHRPILRPPVGPASTTIPRTPCDPSSTGVQKLQLPGFCARA